MPILGNHFLPLHIFGFLYNKSCTCTRKVAYHTYMSFFKHAVPSCLLILCCGAAFAGPPDWQSGVVRAVDSNYVQPTTVKDVNGAAKIQAKGTVEQICTIEAGKTLLVGKREFVPRTNHDIELARNHGVSFKLVGQTLMVKDADGTQRSFQLLKSMPATAANRPDPTAFTTHRTITQ